MVPIVILQVVIHHVSTTLGVIMTAVVTKNVTSGAPVGMNAVVTQAVITAMDVMKTMIVTPAATRRASPMYTLKVVTNLTVGKDHTSLAVHIVNFAQLASTHLQVRRECLLRCLLFSHPIACDIRMCVVSCYISRSLFALVGLFLHE